MSTPKEECEALLNSALPFAERMLREHGEFLPYGHALDSAGKFVAVGATDGREQPPSADVIALLKQGFVQAAREGKYDATALVYDVRVALPSSGEKSDAIAVSLNHRDGYSVVVFFAYQLVDGDLTMGEVFAMQGEADIFRAR